MDFSAQDSKEAWNRSAVVGHGIGGMILAMRYAVELYRARLASSGQVADDAARLDRALNAFSSGEFLDRLRASLANLAASAQAREQAERERDEARKHSEALAAALEEWRSRLATLEALVVKDGVNFNAQLQAMRTERDTARQEAEALKIDLSETREDRDAWHRKANGLQAQVVDHAKALEAAIDQERGYREQHIKEERIRARNEGLEKGSAWAEALIAQGLNPSMDAVAASLRAMKESES